MSNEPNLKTRLSRNARHIRAVVVDDPLSDPVTKGERRLADSLRFLVILGREIADNSLWGRAATLTYTTILSLFPLLILVTSLGSAFYTPEKQEELISFIEDRLMPPTDAGILTPAENEQLQERQNQIQGFVSEIETRSEAFRESAGGLGLAGFVGLLVTGFLLFRTIEVAFEKSWESGLKKPFWRSLAGFTILVVFVPIVVGLSITASSVVLGYLGEESVTMVAEVPGDAAGATDPGRPLESAARPEHPFLRPVKILLYFMTPLFNGIMLAFAYTHIPAAPVKFRYAVVGGIVAGILWEVAKALFFIYIVSSATQRSVLQSLGAVPFFLIWIYFTWIVFLFGNELTCVIQNYRRMIHKHFHRRFTGLMDGRVFLAVMLIVGERFNAGHGGMPRESLAGHLRMSPERFDDVIRELMSRGWLASDENNQLLPAVPPEKLKVSELLAAGFDQRRLLSSVENSGEMVSEALAQIRFHSGAARTLSDLLNPGTKDKDHGEKEA